MSEVKKALAADVAAKYTVKPGIGIGEIVFKGRTIHLDKLSVAQADELVKDDNFDVLVLKSPEKKS